MVNKINEIIESINSGLDPAEVLRIVRTELENYYTKEEVDDLIANIDLSPYYTKTEVDAIVSRVDGDVDAVEGRLNTAEGDIDALEINKQDVLTAGDSIDITNNTVSLSDWEFVPFNEWTSLMEKYSTNGVKVKEDILLFLNFMPVSDKYKYYNFVPLYKNLVYSNLMPLVPIYANKLGISSVEYTNTGGVYIGLRTMYDYLVSHPSVNGVYGVYVSYMGLKNGIGSKYYELVFESNTIVMNKVYYDDTTTIDLTNQNGFGILRRKA